MRCLRKKTEKSILVIVLPESQHSRSLEFRSSDFLVLESPWVTSLEMQSPFILSDSPFSAQYISLVSLIDGWKRDFDHQRSRSLQTHIVIHTQWYTRMNRRMRRVTENAIESNSLRRQDFVNKSDTRKYIRFSITVLNTLTEWRQRKIPEMAKPENPTAKLRAVIARTRLDVLPTTRRKTASIPKPVHWRG